MYIGVLIVLAGCASSSPKVEEARTALEKGRYEAALIQIDEALEQDSADTEAHRLRAKVLRQKADSTMPPDQYRAHYERAREAEDRALSFDPELREEVEATRRRVYDREARRGELAYNRANKRKEEKRYRWAAAYLGAAGATLPDSARVTLNEAYAHLQMGNQEGAISAFERYAERADTIAQKPAQMLGRLYMDLEQYGKAIDFLERAAKMHPGDQDLHSLLLNAYNQSGEMDRGLKVFREQVTAAPEQARFRYNYGALLLRAERYDDAIEQLKKAAEMEPRHSRGQYNLGAAYLNAALAHSDSIATLESEADSTEERAQKIDTLAQKQEELYNKAIPPLERARKLSASRDPVRREACRALLVAYVQTNRPNKAAEVEGCTGFTKADM